MDKIKKISKDIYEIPKEGKQNVPSRIFFSDDMIKTVEDRCLEQLKNVAKLPGIKKYSIGLPDMHVGYGFPIGGVAAFDAKNGVVSPGGVGYDINCGVRLLRTNLTKKELEPLKEEIAHSLQRKIPTGVGRGSPFQLSKKMLDEVLKRGSQYIVEKGYGEKADYEHIEEFGKMPGADPQKVSERAKKRGIGQLGTLGAGNHFLDILVVEEIFDEKTAKVFKLKKEQIVILIHCGSRGLGHQVASDYVKIMEEKFGVETFPDRELAYAPLASQEAKDYLAAMAAAANFAFANKQIITHWLREDLTHYFPKIKIEVLYEVCHNIAKFEEYEIEGKKQTLCVHRKGATRAFGPGKKDLPKDYSKVGQPVLIPGSMGTASYVLVGTNKSDNLTFASSVHGAGRAMSRSKAIHSIKGKETKEKLKEDNIIIKALTDKSVAEEAPEVYKNIDEVVSIMDELGISKKVAKLKPLIVIIG